MIAVDPTVIPLGTRVFVPGYGPAVAADVGIGDQGQHHRSLDADDRAGARLGAAHRHDHHLRLTPVIRRALLLAVAAVACAAATTATAAAPPIQPKLTKALTAPSLSLGRTAALAVDVATGTVLYAHNSSLPVAPASNEKIPVSWAALTSLGAGYRFHTEVYGTGTRSGATWVGDLILKGFGDPTLSTADLDRLGGNDRGTGDPHGQRSRSSATSRSTTAKRGAAGLEALLHRRRDASALGPRRRSRARLAGALAAAARRAERSARRSPVAASRSSDAPGLGVAPDAMR